jgi:mannose-6-phosphate isomerase-like protein (cupin superfamily)
MAQPGETIENASTGERITWLTVGDTLEWEDVWARPGHRAAAHVHPGMEERWEVLSGTAAFRIGGVEQTARPGDVVVAPAGATHEGWNPTDDEVVLRVTMTPALRWAEVVETIFGWARDGKTDANGVPETALLLGLLRDYATEIAPPG